MDKILEYAFGGLLVLLLGLAGFLAVYITIKLTRKPKGGIPKLDTPILTDEDVKDLND